MYDYKMNVFKWHMTRLGNASLILITPSDSDKITSHNHISPYAGINTSFL